MTAVDHMTTAKSAHMLILHYSKTEMCIHVAITHPSILRWREQVVAALLDVLCVHVRPLAFLAAVIGDEHFTARFQPFLTKASFKSYGLVCQYQARQISYN